jgi:hypothetical protein
MTSTVAESGEDRGPTWPVRASGTAPSAAPTDSYRPERSRPKRSETK